MSQSDPPKFLLPFALTWNGPPASGRRNTRPGRGDAGWTVGAFADLGAARAFMAQHPSARLPCWRRVERGEFDFKPEAIAQ